MHVDDVASACVQALHSPARNKTYNISGGEVLSYSEMVESVFGALRRKTRMPTVQLSAFRTGLMTLNRIPRFSQ